MVFNLLHHVVGFTTKFWRFASTDSDDQKEHSHEIGDQTARGFTRHRSQNPTSARLRSLSFAARGNRNSILDFELDWSLRDLSRILETILPIKLPWGLIKGPL